MPATGPGMRAMVLSARIQSLKIGPASFGRRWTVEHLSSLLRIGATSSLCRGARWIDDVAVIVYDRTAGWSSLVARWAHNPKVGGSNPPPATNLKLHIFSNSTGSLPELNEK